MKGLVLPHASAPAAPRTVRRWGRTDTGVLLHNRYSPDVPDEPGAWVEISESVKFGDAYVNGAWVDPERTAEAVRARRDAELRQADDMVWPYLDRGETPPQDLADYKQALRDIPDQAGFPASVVWPVKPQV